MNEKVRFFFFIWNMWSLVKARQCGSVEIMLDWWPWGWTIISILPFVVEWPLVIIGFWRLLFVHDLKESNYMIPKVCSSYKILRFWLKLTSEVCVPVNHSEKTGMLLLKTLIWRLSHQRSCAVVSSILILWFWILSTKSYS